jgi:hypothetical protein
MSADPHRTEPEGDAERAMAEADEANGEGSPANDAEAKYGEDESPA